MKKIWPYIAMFFAGISAGLIAMYKIIGDTVKVEVKKVKNKRVGSSTTTIPINIDTKKESRKEKRNQRRDARKNKK